MATIKIELGDLENLLTEQKRIVAERLLSSTYVFNTESTERHSNSIRNIDKGKFMKVAMGAEPPHDLTILKKYF